MKGFLISVGLIVASGIIFITQYEKIALKYYDQLVAKEGGQEGRAAFETMKWEKPDEFKKKYQDILNQRCLLAITANYLGNGELFMRLARETKELYLNSPVEHNERFGKMVLMMADWLEEKKMDFEAYAQFKEFLEAFPNHSQVQRAQSAAERLRLRHHIG